MQQPSLQRNEIFTSVNYRCRASLLPGICLTTAGRAPCKLRGATLLGMQNPTLQQCKLLGVQIHEPLRMSYSYVSPPGLRAALHRSPTSPSQEGVGLADARTPFTLRDRVSLLRRWATFNSFRRRTSLLSRRIQGSWSSFDRLRLEESRPTTLWGRLSPSADGPGEFTGVGWAASSRC